MSTSPSGISASGGADPGFRYAPSGIAAYRRYALAGRLVLNEVLAARVIAEFYVDALYLILPPIELLRTLEVKASVVRMERSAIRGSPKQHDSPGFRSVSSGYLLSRLVARPRRGSPSQT